MCVCVRIWEKLYGKQLKNLLKQVGSSAYELAPHEKPLEFLACRVEHGVDLPAFICEAETSAWPGDGIQTRSSLSTKDTAQRQPQQ